MSERLVTTSANAATPPPRDGWTDALAEAAEVRDATAKQRYELLANACNAVFQLLHAQREEILAYQEPLSAQTLELIEQARTHQAP